MRGKEEGAACSQSNGGGGSISAYCGMEQYNAPDQCSTYPSASRPPVAGERQEGLRK